MNDDLIRVCCMCKETVKPDMPFIAYKGKYVCEECGDRYSFRPVSIALGMVWDSNETIDTIFVSYSGETNNENTDMVYADTDSLITIAS